MIDRGVPSNKIVVGKPATMADVVNTGYVNPNNLGKWLGQFKINTIGNRPLCFGNLKMIQKVKLWSQFCQQQVLIIAIKEIWIAKIIQIQNQNLNQLHNLSRNLFLLHNQNQSLRNQLHQIIKSIQRQELLMSCQCFIADLVGIFAGNRQLMTSIANLR